MFCAWCSRDSWIQSARSLNRLGLTPITVTLLGVAGNAIAAYFVATGRISLGGLVMLVAWPIDALDGTMARLRGEASDWGAFVDSVSDRYSELLVLGALLYHFAMTNQHIAGGRHLCGGSGLRARILCESAGRGAELQRPRKVCLTRAERYMVLGPSLLFNIPAVGVWIVAILANFTALQRIWVVRAQAHANAKSAYCGGE